MAHELVVISPEKAVLTYRLAGLGSRLLAHLLDILILVVLILIVVVGVGLVVGFSTLGGLDEVSGGIGMIVITLAYSLGPFLYFILFEWLYNGQTIGKKAMGVRVRMADGTPVTFGAALGRNLLRVADLLPGSYFVGLIAMFTNPKSQRIGDLFAGTIVVHERRADPRFHPAPHKEHTHPLEDAVGDLRGMTSEEYWALRRLCDRFPELPRAVQDRLMREVWQPIAYRLKVPAPPNVHPLHLAEAVVMKYGRIHGLL
jgi:uncharacterized RDD family membrane protein YckC